MLFFRTIKTMYVGFGTGTCKLMGFSVYVVRW